MTTPSDQGTARPEDRRACVRYRCARPTVGRAAVAASFKSLKAEVLDLSLEGIGMVLDQPLEIGTRFNIELEGLGEVGFELLGEIVNAQQQADGRWRCGCTASHVTPRSSSGRSSLAS